MNVGRLSKIMVASAVLALGSQLPACGEEAAGSGTPCTDIAECPIAEACIIEDGAEEGSCQFVDCTAAEDTCADTFNAGYECVIDEGMEEGICGQKDGYCDDTIGCANGWEVCNDAFACENSPDFCDDSNPCQEAWTTCQDHLCGYIDCTSGGGDDCDDQGMALYCDATGQTCLVPDGDCSVATDSGLSWTNGAPILSQPLPVTPTETHGVDCPNRLAYEVDYYDPAGTFPTTNAELYSHVRLRNDTDPTKAVVTSFAVADDNATSGTFTFFTCTSTADQTGTWVVYFDTGDSAAPTSNPLCFDL